MSTVVMKDYRNNIITLGDKIVFPISSKLLGFGEIIKINPWRSVKIREDVSNKIYYRNASTIFKYSN